MAFCELPFVVVISTVSHTGKKDHPGEDETSLHY